ncbi:MAG: membrane protein insertase YidC [Gemmatimonadetes bacterium]|nr:membrane protein insertase YidC [Gemmatimonadota bacterium]
MQIGRFLLAIVLMIAVIILTNILFPPARPRRAPPADTAVAGDSVPAAPAETTPAPPPAVPAAPPRVPRVAAAPAVPAETLAIESALHRLGFSTLGGSLVSAELVRFASFTRRGPVQLVAAGAGPLLQHRLRLGDETLPLDQLPFQAEPSAGFELGPESAPRALRLSYQDTARGLSVRLQYLFRPEDYVVEVEGRVEGSREPATLLLDLGPTLAVNEANPSEDYRALAYVLNHAQRGIRSARLDAVESQRIEEGPLLWVALKNKYFLMALVRSANDGRPFGGLIADDTPREHAARLTATLPLTREGTFSYRVYLGPQEYDRLVALGQDLEDVNPYGWRVLRPIIRPLAHLITWALIQLHGALGFGYGWVLILFGFLVRGALWPLNARAMRSQLKTMELQPRLKEIQEKHKGDPERLQKEMLRLYREEGFNPLGGCLPMLIPFPVLITLFFVFQGTIEFRGVGFLWLPDLSRADPFYVLPILLGVSMFALQWLSTRAAPAPNPQMKMMLWFMPIFMTIIFLNLASGLNLYYFASNVASVPQQLQLTRERQRRQRP